MTLVPPTTKSHRRPGLAVSWRSTQQQPAAESTRKARGHLEPMSTKRAHLKDPLQPDGAAVALSPSLAFCSALKCPRPADGDDDAEGLARARTGAGNVKVDKWMGKNKATAASAELSPPKTIDKHMPKARNRHEPITALFPPAMHRKSKGKTKSNTTTPGSRSNTTFCAGPQHMKRRSETSKLKNTQFNSQTDPRPTLVTAKTSDPDPIVAAQNHLGSSTRINISNKKKANAVRYKMLIPLPTLGATSFVTLLTILCIETVLLSTMSSCAKTFYMHWNTSNSIFRIDNTDHIIDVNKGNLAFEFDQVHIICPVYEPGAFENETEKYIIYNVSKVEYETCRITNADPRVIAICDKPQKLMFFTITFRPFTPQPGGLEFLPGNDYYFISTSSKDDLYRRIGGRCSTNNMKVVFKVCCAPEEKNKTTETTLVGSGTAESGTGSVGKGVDNAVVDLNQNGHNGGNTIGISGGNSGFLPGGAAGGSASGSGSGNGVQLKPINGMSTSINTNIDQFNRIPIQPNIIGNNIGAGGGGGGGGLGGNTGGIMLTPGHGSINMLPPGRGGVHMTYPGHHHIQTGIRINNVPTQPNNPHTHHKGNINVNSNGKDYTLIKQAGDDQFYLQEVGSRSTGGSGNGGAIPINIGKDIHYLPPVVDTNHSNIVQSTINWPVTAWGAEAADTTSSNILTSISTNSKQLFHPKHTNQVKINTTSDSQNNTSISNYTPSSHSPPDLGNNKTKNDHHNYDKHPNEVVKNEELTYNSGSGRVSRSHIWIWTCLPTGGVTTMGLTSMCAYGINLTILVPVIVVIIFNYLLGIRVANTMGRRRTETLGIYR